MPMQSQVAAPASAPARALDRQKLVAWYARNRARSKQLFELLTDDTYYTKPIALRHPVVFYDGHLPAFSFNTLVKRGLGGRSIDALLEQLFARGIDPHESAAAGDDPVEMARRWPSREAVRQFASEADWRVVTALARGDIVQPGHPLLDRGEAAFCILEHEAMHHETLLYMWHQVPYEQKQRPVDYALVTDGPVPAQSWVTVTEGEAVLGVAASAETFTWDNERPEFRVVVPEFRIERHDVTNAAFMAFVEAGGYDDERWWSPADWAWRREEGVAHPPFWQHDQGRWWWRAMFERVPLPPSWPVYVTQAEAAAYARWHGGRLPTEAEYQRAAYGSPTGEPRRYPWGDAAPTSAHGLFDMTGYDPHPAGSHPAGDSAWGIADLMGNGWEWTSSEFAPFPGFTPLLSYPKYSADFFDGDHYVMKGASPATACELLRPTFRNWFRPRYPFVYAAFRCVATEVR